MNADMAPREQGMFHALLQDHPVGYRYSVHRDFSVSLEFTLRGRPYSFRLTKWKQGGQATFLPLFFQHEPRDPATFGSMTMSEDLTPSYDQSEAQHVAAVVRAAKDVVRCLDQILRAYERSVLDYAVWYREKHPETGTYNQLITLVCCHCIVHSDFLAPAISYPLLTFTDT